MRVAIATQTYDPPLNGQGVFAIHLSEGLAHAGHEVLVLRPSEEGHAYRRQRNAVQAQGVTAVPLVPFASQVYVTPLPGGQVREALDRFEPEIVHLQDHYPVCRAAMHAAQERHLPLVGTNHFLPANVIDEVGFLRLAPGLFEPLLWKWVFGVFAHLDVITTPTETAANDLRQQGLSVPIHAISNGVDTDHFRPQPDVDCARMRRRYDLDPDAVLFLYVGRVAWEKRLDVLLHAFERLDRPDLQLAIAGRGPYAEELQEEARELLPERRVVFTGFVPDEDLPALLNSADIFAMPSEAELQSIATLEAMATGRPILASNAEALPELVKEGVNGCLFESGNVEDAMHCVVAMAEGRERWAAMGAASRVMAEAHDLSNTIRRYEELYRSVLQGRAD